MLCLGDIAELTGVMTIMDRYNNAVRVVKHEYVPTEETKFLNQVQTKYERKNWSSVMVFNNALCTKLTPEYVEKAPGLELHQFLWCTDHQIASLAPEWNYLVGVENQHPNPKLIHYTKATPCFDSEQEYADLWWKEYKDMNSYG